MRRLLKPGGVVLVVASRRCGSLSDFERRARVEFAAENWGTDYDVRTMSLLAGKKCFPYVVALRHHQLGPPTAWEN